MNHRERLAICSSCKNRKLDFDFGYVCQLTGRIADFNGSCKDYVRDETVTDNLKIRMEERPFVPLFDPPPQPTKSELKKRAAKEKDARRYAERVQAQSQAAARQRAARPASPGLGAVKQEVEQTKRFSKVARKKLRRYQNFLYALLGGSLVAMIGALGWAFATAMTGFQAIYMALGVGLLVGIAVRYFGAGINRVFGVLAALLALAGSLAGNYLSQSGFPEEANLASILRVPEYLQPDVMISSIRDTFVPLDLLYYGLAALLAYLLAIRRVGSRKIARLETDGYRGAPALYWARLPLILILILLPAYYGYTLTRGDSGGLQTVFYDSGTKMSEGEIQHSQKTGEWTTWHENGNIQSVGYYLEGKKDSLWKWYDESGILTSAGMYDNDLENGTWMDYYPDGVVSDSGSYQQGLKEGLWKHFHETGDLMYSVNYKGDRMHGERVLLTPSGDVVKVDHYEDGVLVEQ
jgi:antitoxin component YwqK of YwqJK toxin-antitoxin module